MAWNEPGQGGKDPWGRGNGRQGPPDLEELLARLRKRLGGLGGGGGSGSASIGFLIIAIIVVVLWLLSGFYKVDSAEKAAVLRFGKLTSVAKPGLHWHIPYPVESVKTVNVDRVRSFPYEADMLTGDENIVHFQLEVQYIVKNAGNYLFQISDPDKTLSEATKSAVRQVVGTSKMDDILSGKGRQEVVERTQEILQKTLNNYKSGLHVNTVNLKSAQPPDQVQAAYADVIKARQDKQQSINHAQAYRNKILPVAKGEAARKIAQAQGYAKQVVAEAQGHASHFDQLVKAYHKAPEVTRKRLYLDAMQDVLQKSSKVLLDVNKSNPLLYLPLNKLLKAGKNSGKQQESGTSSNSGSGTEKGQGQTNSSSSSTSPQRSQSRSRTSSLLGQRGAMR